MAESAGRPGEVPADPGSITSQAQRVVTMSGWRRHTSIARIEHSPVLPAVISGLAAAVFAVGRLVVAAGGHVGAFVVAGRLYASPGQVPPGVAVGGGSGYDGQFYYRIALDPLDFARRAFGIRLDSIARLGRIGYPALAWVLSGGQRAGVPAALVVTNVVGLAALGLAGGLLARSSGRLPIWGLVLPGYFGFLWTLGRDLTEITAAAFLLLGIYAYRRDRYLWAGLALLAAVLCKEDAAYVVLAFGFVRVVTLIVKRRWREFGAADLPWAVPAAGFVAWQLVVGVATGTVPVLASGGANVGAPLVGLVGGMHHYLVHPLTRASVLWWGELLVLVALTLAAALSVTSTSAPLRERVAWAAVIALALSAASGIWKGDVGFRSLDTVYLFDWILLLGTRRRLWPAVAVSGAAWLVVFVQLVRFI